MLPVVSSWPLSEKDISPLCLRLSEVLQPWAFPGYTIDSHWVSTAHFAAQSSVIRHVHQFYEGFVILDGAIELITPWQSQRLASGHLLVFSPSTVHQWQTQEQSCLALALSFDLNRPLLTPTRMCWPVVADVLWDVQVLLANVAARAPGWQQRAHCHMGVLYSRLLSLLERPSAPEPAQSGVSQLVARIDELLLAHLPDSLTMDELAGSVSMSVRHLTRVYRTITGTTIHERLEVIRMERAAKLLCTTNLTVENIARAVGVSDAAYFARRFRRRFDVTPRAYRRQLQPSGS